MKEFQFMETDVELVSIETCYEKNELQRKAERTVEKERLSKAFAKEVEGERIEAGLAIDIQRVGRTE